MLSVFMFDPSLRFLDMGWPFMTGEGAVMILMALQLADYTWSHRRFIIAELFCALTAET